MTEPMDTIPIIRLEVSRMRHVLQVALLEHSAAMDADMQHAIEQFCTPENIHKIIHEAADGILNTIIKEEVQNFFRFGDGRGIVAEAVKTKLLNRATYTPIDEAGPAGFCCKCKQPLEKVICAGCLHVEAAMKEESAVDCADCGKKIEGKPIYWCGTSARCQACHHKRMHEGG